MEIKKNDKAFSDTKNLKDKDAVFRYEHLRSYGGISGRHSRERDLFVKKGLFFWMEAWARYIRPISGCIEKTDPQGISVHKEHLAEGIHPQVIDILADFGCIEKTDPQGISVHKERLAEGIHPQIIDILAEMAMAVYGGAEEV